jgi:hypothetical protein
MAVWLRAVLGWGDDVGVREVAQLLEAQREHPFLGIEVPLGRGECMGQSNLAVRP